MEYTMMGKLNERVSRLGFGCMRFPTTPEGKIDEPRAEAMLKRAYDAGVNYFMMTVKPRVLCPMHFWGRGDIITEFARRARTNDTEILPLTIQGQAASLVMEDDGFMNISMLNPPVSSPAHVAYGESVSLDGYEGADPFLETDLPVDMGEGPNRT